MFSLKSWQKNKKLQIFVFLVVFFFTFIIRAHNYDRTPVFGQLEELMYGWAGMYLLEEGTPVAWSTLNYPKEAEVFSGKIDYQGGIPEVYVTLYKPWLDEPPLFSLLVGGVSHLYHADKTKVIPSSYLRLPMIFIATLMSLLIFLIVRRISSFWMGVLAMLLYGTIPIMVFASRMAVPENLIALGLLVIVYLIMKYETQPKRWLLLLVPVIAGLAGLAKPTGYFLLPLGLFYALKQKDYRLFVMMILVEIPFIAAFLWYGISYNADIFWEITRIQSLRPVGFSSLAWFFVSPAYDINYLIDSWYVFATLAAGYFIFKKDTKIYPVVFALVYWILIVMISGGEGDLLPWYRYPTFPLLAICAAFGVREVVLRADFFATFLAVGFFLGGRHLLVNAFRPNITPMGYRLTVSALMLPSVLQIIFEQYSTKFLKLSRYLIVGMIVLGLYWNSLYIYNVFELNCESITCPFGPTTWLSTLHFPLLNRLFVLGEPTLH